MIKTFYIRTPFLAAKKFVGIEPSNCLMIDKQEFEDIEKFHGDEATIILDVDFTSWGLLVREKRSITVKEMRQLLSNKMAKTRKNKSSNHTGINFNRLNCKLINSDM